MPENPPSIYVLRNQKTPIIREKNYILLRQWRLISPGKWVLGRGENYDRLMNKNMLLECIVSIACKLDKNIWQKNWVKASIKLYLLWKQTRYPNHFYTNFTFVKHLLIHIEFVSVCIYHIHKFLIQSQALNYINNVFVKFGIEINCIRKECVANNRKNFSNSLS